VDTPRRAGTSISGTGEDDVGARRRGIEHCERCRYGRVIFGIDERHFGAEIVREVCREPADQDVGVLLAIVEYPDAQRAVDAGAASDACALRGGGA
jgi:hypothetical protein